MPSTFSPNKNLELPAAGSYVNTWSLPVNSDFSAIDTALGGNYIVNVTGIAPGTYAIPLAAYQPPNIIVDGTIGATLVYQFPSGVGGVWTIYNNTSGAFSLTVGSAGGGRSIVLPQGIRTMIVCDGVNVDYSASPPIVTGVVQSGEVRNNTTVLSNSNYLQLAINTPGTYEISLNVAFTTVVGAGFACNVNYSGTYSDSGGVAYLAGGSNANPSAGYVFPILAAVQATQNVPLILLPGGTNTVAQGLIITATITISTPGLLGFAFAQATATVGNTYLLAGSFAKLAFV